MNTGRKLKWLIALALVAVLTLAVGVGLAEELTVTVGDGLKYAGGSPIDVNPEVKYGEEPVALTSVSVKYYTQDDTTFTNPSESVTLPGSYVVRVTYTPDEETGELTATQSFSVGRALITSIAFEDGGTTTYTGSDITPTVVVTAEEGAGTPAVDTDYTVTRPDDSIVNVGDNYSFTVSLTENSKYEFGTDVSGNLTYKVTAKNVTIEWPEINQEIEYGNPLKAWYSSASDENGYGTFSWKGKDEGTEIPQVETPQYTLQYSLNSNNYTVGDANTEKEYRLKVSPKEYTLGLSDSGVAGKTYDGGEVADLKALTQIADLQAGETAPAYTVTAGDDVTVQDAKKYTLTGEFDSPNYTFGTNNQVEYEITQAKVTAVNYVDPDAGKVTYNPNGITIPNSFTFTTDPAGLTDITYTGPSHEDIKEEGTYELRFTFSGNFKCEGDALTLDFVVTPAVISNITIDPTTKIYSPNTSYSASQLANSVTAGNFTVAKEDFGNNFTFTINGSEGESAENQGTYTVEVKSNNHNYSDPTDPVTAKFTITKAKVSLSSAGVPDRQYSVNTSTKISDLINLTADNSEVKTSLLDVVDLVVVDENGESYENTLADVGTYTITAKIKDNYQTNYEMVEGGSVTYKITPAIIDVTGSDSRVYNGDKTEVEDVITVTSTPSEPASDLLSKINLKAASGTFNEMENVGEYTITATIKKDYERNYEIGENSATYEITKADLTVNWSNDATDGKKTYDAETESPENLLDVTFNGDEVTDVIIECEKQIHDAGIYVLSVNLNTDLNNNNFNVPTDETYEIVKKDIKEITLADDRPYNKTTTDKNAIVLDVLTGLDTGNNADDHVPASDYTVSVGGNKPICDADEYEITVTVNDSCTNFKGTKIATYKVTQAELTDIELTKYTKVYNGSDTDINKTLKKKNGVSTEVDGVTLADGEYTLKEKDGKALNEVGTYTIVIDTLNANFADLNGVSATFEITEAPITELTINSTGKIYDQEETTLDSLGAVVKASTKDENGADQTLTLIDKTDYELTSEKLEEAGSYTISIDLKNKNYSYDTTNDKTYTITPAELKKLTLGQDSSIYDSENDVDLSAIQNLRGTELTATSNNGEIILPKTEYTLEPSSISTTDKADKYTIHVSLNDTKNYYGDVTAEYVVNPAALVTLTLKNGDYIYDQKPHDPQTELREYIIPTLEDEQGNVVPDDRYELKANKTIQNADTYTIIVKLTEKGEKYYTNDENIVKADFTVKPATIDSLTLGKDKSTYNSAAAVVLADIQALDETVVTATTDEGEGVIVLPKDAYKLVPEKIDVDQGEGKYTISVELNDTTNYLPNDSVTATYEIGLASLKSLTLKDSDYIYNQNLLDPNKLNLGPSVLDEFDNPVAPEMYTLTVDNMKDAGEYTIKVVLTKEGQKYYENEGEGISAPFTVLPATIDTLTLGRTESVYNRVTPVNLAEIHDLPGTSVTATTDAGVGAITLLPGEYKLSPVEISDGVGTYDVKVELVDTNNYAYATEDVKAEYKITAATLKALILADADFIYDQVQYTAEDLRDVMNPYVSDQFDLQVLDDCFELVADKNIQDVGTYTISVRLTDEGTKYYTGSVSAQFAVTPANIDSFTLGQASSVYDSAKPVVLADIQKLENTIVTATTDDGAGEITLPKEAYKLNPETISKGEGTYTISIVLNDTKNYTDTDKLTQDYEITLAALDTLTLGDADYIYDQKEYTAEELRSVMKPTLKDQFGNEVANDLYELRADKTIQNAGTYTITVELTDEGKGYYTNDTAKVNAVFTVKAAVLDGLTLGKTESVYDLANPVDVTEVYKLDETILTATTDEGTAKITVPKTAYTLTPEKISDGAGEYTISIKLVDTTNYADNAEKNVTATYVIKSGKVASLTLADADYIYDQQKYTAEDLRSVMQPTVVDNNGETVPAARYTLQADEDIQTAGKYTITVVLTDEGKKYYVEDTSDVTAEFEVLPANVDSLTLAVTESVYNSAAPVVLADIQKLDDTIVTATTDDGEGEIELPKTAYKLVPEEIKDGIGEYTIKVELIDTTNYTNTNEGEAEVTATYTIKAATLKSLELTDKDWVYNQKLLDPNALNLGPKVKDEFDNDVTTDMYTLTVANLQNAGDYTIKVTLTDEGKKYYQDTTEGISAAFTILPAPIKTLILGKATSVYNRQAVPVTIEEMIPTLIAVGDKVGGGTEEIIVPTDNANYAMISEDGDIINVGKYTISPVLADKNYTNKDAEDKTIIVTAEYEITPATLKEIVLDPAEVIYRKSGYDAERNFKNGDSKATVTAIGNGEEDVFEVPLEDVILTSDRAILNVGTYTITATAVTDNYDKEATVNTAMAVKLQQVKPIVITVNGVKGLRVGENRLGGPNEALYHSITLEGQENEEMTVVVTGSTGTVTFLKAVSGKVITITNNSIVNGDVTLPLDTTGDVEYTITASYDDGSNLKVSEEEVASVPVSDTFFYDMVCKAGSVAETLMNRQATGILINAAEDYRNVSFAANGGSENNFTASEDNVPMGDGHLVAFGGISTKFFSTDHNAANQYGGTFTDLLGNTATIDGQTIGKSSGTLVINSVNPAPNENGWIGLTPTLTWDITMTSDGRFDELVHLSVGGYTESPTLKQGSNADVTTNTQGLQNDVRLFVTISFDDLNGSATFQSIGYDKQADVPVMTTRLYDGCNVLAGKAEPNVVVTITVNGESISVTSDRWGAFFTDQLPLAYEGDIVTIRYVDKAGNYVTIEQTVGEELDTVRMDAYMLGKVLTNATAATQSNEEATWVNVLNATQEDLQNGRVKLPIIAGNIVKVGEITIIMDGDNVITYDYTLDEGIEQIGDEIVVVDPNRNADAMVYLNGITIDKNGTKVTGKGKNPTYSIVAKFVVDVPTEYLEETFQTKSESESTLKTMYVQRQTQRALKDSIILE